MVDERQQFTVAITCPNCDAPGAVVWEESVNQDSTPGSQRRLVSVHGAFHRETGRSASRAPLIVCNVCDEIQPD
jgi:hypothetical protein